MGGDEIDRAARAAAGWANRRGVLAGMLMALMALLGVAEPAVAERSRHDRKRRRGLAKANAASKGSNR